MKESWRTIQITALMYSLLPASFLILASIFIIGYTLNRHRIRDVQVALAKQR